MRDVPCSRWTVLVAAMFMMLSCGSVYGFGAIASKVKDALGASEAEVQLIGIMGNLGMGGGQFVGGVVVDRYGPRVTMLAAALMLCVGYVTFHVALSSRGSRSSGLAGWAGPYTAVALWFLVGHGCGWLYNAAMFTSARNFGDARRGMVVGLLSSFMGAASTVCVSLLNACLGGHLDGGDCVGGGLDGNLSSYMLTCGIMTTVFALAGAVCSRRLSPEELAEVEERESGASIKLLNNMVVVVVAVLVYVMAGGMLHATHAQKYIRFSLWSPFGLAALLLLFLLVPVAARRADPDALQKLNPDACDTVADTVSVLAEPRAAVVQQTPLSPSTAVRQPEFWLLWVMCAGVLGANIMTLNITSTIVKDRRIGSEYGVSDSTMANVFVMGTMATSSLCRLLTGKCIWALRGVPRMTYFFVSAGSATLGQVLWSVDASGAAFVAAWLVGVSDGVVWTVAPWLCGKMFGLRHNGGNFGSVILLSAVGWVLLSNVVEPAVYSDHEGSGSVSGSSGSGECYGVDCFRTTHLAAAGASALSLAASAALALQLRSKLGEWV